MSGYGFHWSPCKGGGGGPGPIGTGTFLLIVIGAAVYFIGPVVQATESILVPVLIIAAVCVVSAIGGASYALWRILRGNRTSRPLLSRMVGYDPARASLASRPAKAIEPPREDHTHYHLHFGDTEADRAADIIRRLQP